MFSKMKRDGKKRKLEKQAMSKEEKEKHRKK